MQTQHLKWLLLLTVYGVETILTIIERLSLRENILDAHRRHLYQLFANERKTDHRLISLIYAAVQLLVNILVLTFTTSDWILIPAVTLSSAFLYLLKKYYTKKSISHNQ